MKFFWSDSTLGKKWKDRKGIITAALESGATGVIVKQEDVEKTARLGNIDIVVEDSGDTGKAIEKGATGVLIGKGGEGDGSLKLPENLDNAIDFSRIKKLKKDGITAIGYVEIQSKGHERLAALEAKIADFVVAIGKDWKVIPLENLIAEVQKEKRNLIAGVKDSKEAKLALETLEIGADGVLLQTKDINEIKKVSNLIGKTSLKLELKTAEITKLKQVGMGDRVCVDTASLLNVGEGMLLGSQSNGLFLIHSETLESEYVSSRPFRVNAGAVHAYIMTPEGKTKYLSEVKSGDEVLVTDSKGNTRSVIVGRVKIEKRPLILVEGKCEGRTYTTLLQNAETITVVGKNGKPISISKLKVGDEILIYTKDIGRHFGMEVEESVVER